MNSFDDFRLYPNVTGNNLEGSKRLYYLLMDWRTDKPYMWISIAYSRNVLLKKGFFCFLLSCNLKLVNYVIQIDENKNENKCIQFGFER